MALRPRLQELEPISPELVLVSPPDVARRAREELREPPLVGYAEAAVRDRLPEPLPPVDIAEPAGPRSRRRWHRIALASAAIGAVAAAAAYVVVARDNTRHVDDFAAVGPSRGSAPPKTREAAPTQTATTTSSVHAQRRRSATAASAPSAVVTAAPTVNAKHSGKPKRPKAEGDVVRASGFVPARTWTWPKSRGARAYELQFLRNGRVVLDVRTTQPRLVLPRTFRFRAGTYRWVVQRIPFAANRRPIVDSRFFLTRAVAARANR